MRIHYWAMLGIASTSLVGCASHKDTVLPAEGPDMKAIYEAHISDIGVSDRLAARAALEGRPPQGAEADLNGYVRDAFNELDTHFPRLPNPTLVMYVFPHLAGEQRVPVPGYATTFPLYTQVEYALPGELDEPRLRRPDPE